MHRAIILIAFCFYTIFLPFTQASEVNKEGGRRIVKRKIGSLANLSLTQDNGQEWQSPSNRPRTESEVTTTTTATTTESSSNLLGPLHFSPGTIGSSSESLTNSATGSSLSADVEADKVPEPDTTGTIIDSETYWDSFEFNLGMGFDAFFPSEGRLKAQHEEDSGIEKIMNNSKQISELVIEPFRADYGGRTVIIIPNGEGMEENLKKYEGLDYILHDDFLYHLMNLCSLNYLFEAVSRYKNPHFLNDAELAAIELDESSNDYVIFDGTSEPRSVPVPPLHPLYALAREVVFYYAINGKSEYIKEAIDAGMNMNFIIHLKNKKLKMNLLQFLLRFAKNISIPIIELLVKDAKIDVNEYDSDGLSGIHYLALHDAIGPFEAIVKACSGAINLNAPTKWQTFLYPIHLAAYKKSYRFLKPFIYLPTVDINVLDHQKNHLLHYAINFKSFGFFTDLLKHPKLVLQYNSVKKAFILIKSTIPIEDSERYLDVFTAYLIERKHVHVSHIHFITFFLVSTQYIKALESLQKNNFDFTFIHKSSHSRPDSSVVSVAAHFDRLESFKFLQRALPTLNIEVFILLAIRRNAHKIIEYLLETDQIPEASLKEILELIIKIDDSTSFHLFSTKFGQEKIFTFIDREDIDFGTCPGIFMYQLLHQEQDIEH